MSKKALTRETILKVMDLQTETVEVPEWGGTVHVRTLTGTERDTFETSLFEGQGTDQRQRLANLRAGLVALCVVDEDGNRIFSDGDAEALGFKSAAALDRVFAVAQRLNGLGPAGVEELVKN